MSEYLDPPVPDWAALELPKSWADAMDLGKPAGWLAFLRALKGSRKPVQLPQGLDWNLPKYLCQEFHNLPNGNYSRQFSRGYITGFDISMLGQVRPVRRWMAAQLLQVGESGFLDIGCAGGRLAGAIVEAGGADVWGLDPSPYLLQHAAADQQQVKFVPGLAEQLPFSDRRFTGVGICFVFHEIPPNYIKKALAEIYRVLKPGGRLVIAEPSPEQLEPFRWRDLLPFNGWKKIYFRALAKRVFEPFVPAWHKLDKPELFRQAGFELVDSRPGMPIDAWILEKP